MSVGGVVAFILMKVIGFNSVRWVIYFMHFLSSAYFL